MLFYLVLEAYWYGHMLCFNEVIKPWIFLKSEISLDLDFKADDLCPVYLWEND